MLEMWMELQSDGRVFAFGKYPEWSRLKGEVRLQAIFKDIVMAKRVWPLMSFRLSETNLGGDLGRD